MDSAVAKAFGLLELISRSKGPARLTTLALDLGLGKSTVHRVLGELIELGYIEQDETGLYRPTLRTWEIGTAVVSDLPIKQVAAGALQRLHEQTGETVSLVVRADDEALYLDKLVSPRPIRFTTRIGSRVPLPLAAGGKAILAHDGDGVAVVQRTLERSDLPSGFDPDAALAEIARARKRGYATSSFRSGVASIAAAVLDRDESPVAALSVSAPTERLGNEKKASIVEAVVGTANQLAEALGRV